MPQSTNPTTAMLTQAVQQPEHAVAQPSSGCVVLMVAATASGQGKTLVTAALARWHVRQGRRVRIFKCGPDFLDPCWHELASGAVVHNLDLWMTGEADIQARLAQAAQEADVILIEGVMGLYDGRPSAADLALRWNISVLAVLQVGAMAQTCAAVVYGLKHYQPGLRFAGVLCNHVASAKHASLLQQSLEPTGDWLGALPKLQAADCQGSAAAFLPSRHLGLVSAAEVPDALARLDQAADALAQTPLGQMPWSEWQNRWSVDVVPSPVSADHAKSLQGKTIAIAHDAAFAFVYPANVQVLQDLGASIAFFSPLAGDDLPVCDALWLPGGYPELHAPVLQRNTPLRASIHAHWQQNKPIWAECGGMLALAQSVRLRDGSVEALWGLLPAQATMQARLAGLGHQQLDWPTNHALPALRGHTFHYSTLDCSAPAWTYTQRPDASAGGEAVYRHGSLTASYFHAWFASSPEWVARLFLGALP